MGMGLGSELGGGVILIALSAVMVFFGRPKGGDDMASFLRGPWIVGKAFVMASLISFVMGVSLLLTHWPY